ncbi:hypothetical protein JNW90_29370 [Micromonospora sp. STR1s_5]|nr:hypothetical protein [Micromonospora sp. STR1s_5]
MGARLTTMEHRLAWLRGQMDLDEQWALAASRPYRHARWGCYAPSEGVEWRWVEGRDWDTVPIDPAARLAHLHSGDQGELLVSEPGYSCNLATVQEWPGKFDGQRMPRVYASSMVEVDAAAAGHILRNDPRSVIGRVTADRLLVDLLAGMLRPEPASTVADPQEVDPNALMGLRFVALRYARRPGYREMWAPSSWT